MFALVVAGDDGDEVEDGDGVVDGTVVHVVGRPVADVSTFWYVASVAPSDWQPTPPLTLKPNQPASQQKRPIDVLLQRVQSGDAHW